MMPDEHSLGPYESLDLNARYHFRMMLDEMNFGPGTQDTLWGAWSAAHEDYDDYLAVELVESTCVSRTEKHCLFIALGLRRPGPIPPDLNEPTLE